MTEYARRDPDAKIEQDEEQTESDQIDTSRSWRGTTPEFIHALMCSGPREFPWRKAHPIHYYYGLHHFIILSPSTYSSHTFTNPEFFIYNRLLD